jgi:hypothetical protein
MSATPDDAASYLKLMEIWQSPVQSEARAWFWGAFEAASLEQVRERYPRGSAERAHLFNIIAFYECAAVLVHRGLLDEDLFFDAPFGFEVVWELVGPILEEWRADTEPAAWENIIWLGRRFTDWDATVWRSKLDAASES